MITCKKIASYLGTSSRLDYPASGFLLIYFRERMYVVKATTTLSMRARMSVH